jgi:hemerythrin-like domain-containing protein
MRPGPYRIARHEKGGNMATATDILRHEHEAVLKMLDASESAARKFDAGGKVPSEVLADLLEFFRVFTDQCHHMKEEELFFPMLERKGIPRDGGPVGVMLHEHEEGRALIREMVIAAEAYHQGEESAPARWSRAARAYAQLLREHIFKENNVLFIMAERVLTSAEQAQLAESFEKLEIEKMGAGTHERLHAKMDQVIAALASK